MNVFIEGLPMNQAVRPVEMELTKKWFYFLRE
jgi:hypothetical protein